MANKSTYRAKFARRRKEQTNYSKRLALVKSGKARLVVRKSNKHVLVQIVEFGRNGDRTVASAFSRELEAFGWNAGAKSVPAAYLTGLLCGKRAVEKGVNEAVPDIGLVTPVHGSAVFSALKGAIDSGLKIKAEESVFPSQERINGKHIAGLGEKIGKESLKGVPMMFEETKKRMLEGKPEGKIAARGNAMKAKKGSEA